MNNKCLYCESEDLRDFVVRVDGKKIMRCSSCGLMFVGEPPLDNEALYGKDYFDKDGYLSEKERIGYIKYGEQPEIMFLWQKILVDYFKKGSYQKLLDVGCGFGKLMKLLEASYTEFYVNGIDVSDHALEAASKEGLAVRKAKIQDIAEEGLIYDIITAFDVIEHEADIKSFLSSVHKALSDDGILIFSTPDCDSEIAVFKKAEWAGYSYSLEHILYLTKSFMTKSIADTFGHKPTLFTIMQGENRTIVGIVNKTKEITDFRGPFFTSLIENILEVALDSYTKQKSIENLNPEIEIKNKKLELLKGEIDGLKKEVHQRGLEMLRKDDRLKELGVELANLRLNITSFQSELNETRRLLSDVYNSKTWRLGQIYGKIMGVESALRGKWLGKLRNTVKKKFNFLAPPAVHTTGDLQAGVESVSALIESVEAPQEAFMGSTYDVFFFPMISFSFRYQRPQQLASYFAKKGHRVFYMNFMDCLSAHSEDDFRVSVIRDRVYEVFLKNTHSLDVYGGRLDAAVLSQLYSSLDSLRNKYGLWTVAGIVHNPFWSPLAFRLKEDFGWRVVYDCMDDWDDSIFRGVGQPVLEEEMNLAKNADLLTATAGLLCDKWLLQNSSCTLVRNAADYEHYRNAVCRPLLSHIRKPIVGFFGGIAEWIDVEAIQYVASRRQDISFVLIGEVFTDVSSIKRLPNVHLPGNKPYEDMPSYLADFDVCLIPVKKTKVTEAMDHVKLYEYFTSGKPVVARAIHELKEYSDLIYLYETKEEFLESIDKALNEKNREIAEKRKAFASTNTWADRVKLMDEKIRASYGKASIVIVTINNLEINKTCIESILSRTDYPDYEIIVVDNASTDGTRQYLKELEEAHDFIKVILNDKNEGFPKATNMGTKLSSGNYIVFLNNDTIVTKGWLTKLIHYLNRYPDIGLIGPVTNSCANEARIDVELKDISEIDKFAYLRGQAYEGNINDIKMLAFYCVAMRRELIEKVGLLEESFGIGMFEDDDYSHRVKLQGYRVVYAGDIFIYHLGRKSFKKLDEDGTYNDTFYKNKAIFESKWKMQWQMHQSLPKAEQDIIRAVKAPALKSGHEHMLDAILRENRDAKGIILHAPAMEWSVPLKQRPQHIALEMASKGYLYLYSTSNLNYDKVNGFEKAADRVYVTDQHDLIVSKDIPYIYNLNSICPRKIDGETFERINQNHITIYDYIDHIHEYISGPTTEFIYKRHMLINPDIIACTAQVLNEEMLRRFPPDRVHYLPNAADYRHFHITKDFLEVPDDISHIVGRNKPIIGYFGALAKWIDYNLLNLLAERRPDIEIIIIGWDYDQSNRALRNRPNLHSIGTRPYDILPKYAVWFDVAIIPFGDVDISSSTSPIKLFEYMALGKPIVTTDMHECRKYRSVLASKDHKEFLANIDKALKLRYDEDYLKVLDEEARRNTWTARAVEIEKAIIKASGTKKPPRKLSSRMDDFHADLNEKGLIEGQTAGRYRLKFGNQQNPDIISFPIMHWSSRFQRSQQILSRFAYGGSRVFRISTFFNASSDSYRKSQIQYNVDGITLSSLKNLNIWEDSMDEQNLEIMFRTFKEAVRGESISDAVCIVELPFWFPLVKRIKEEFRWKVVYDCMDEHSGFSTSNEKTRSDEILLAENSDIIVTTAQSLYEKMNTFGKKCVLIRNAADFEHFHYLPTNDLLKDVKRPIIGYYGAISDWFDNELVEFLAKAKKEWSFVLIGDTLGADISRLEKIPNVYFLGEKPYTELPKYLFWFDVCFIPFKVNELTKATNPVKFYEYASSGKPIVSSPLPELLGYGSLVALASDKRDFLRKLQTALNEKESDNEKAYARIEFAKINTWDERVRSYAQEISKLYPKHMGNGAKIAKASSKT